MAKAKSKKCSTAKSTTATEEQDLADLRALLERKRAEQPPYVRVEPKPLITAPTKPPMIVKTPQPPTPEQLAAQHAEQVRQQREQQIARATGNLLDSLGLDYHEASLNEFALYDPAQKKVLAELREFQAQIVQRTTAGEGLILFGPSSTGKDFAAAAIMLAAARQGIPARWLDVRDLCGLSFDDAEKMILTVAPDRKERHHNEPSILTLSDPGRISDVNIERIHRIVDRRARDRLSTWLTCNALNEADVKNLLGTAVFSRLRYRNQLVYCNWENFRLRKGKNKTAPVMKLAAAGPTNAGDGGRHTFPGTVGMSAGK